MSYHCFLALLLAISLKPFVHAQTELQQAIDRSAKLLAKEVPNWISENKCASCHNQGDGARALIMLQRAGKNFEPDILSSTFQWLEEPAHWEKNRGLPEASDQKLANLHFAATLALAFESDPDRFRGAVEHASQLLVPQQSDDGAWRIEDRSTFASPITQGPILLTGQAIRLLKLSSSKESKAAIANGVSWLGMVEPRNTLERSSLLLAWSWAAVKEEKLVLRYVSEIVAAQSEGGGWGPHANAAPEIYDTALAIIALRSASTDNIQAQKSIAQGIKYLLRNQYEDGSWNATTRPAGTESYAHRISTIAWATQALMLARNRATAD